MVWYRTKTGKIKTVKLNAKTQGGAINQAKKKPGFSVKMRVLKLKDEKPKKTTRKKTTKKRKTTKRKKSVRKKTKKKAAPKKRAVKRTRRKSTKKSNPKKKGRKRMAKKKTTKKRRRRRGNPNGKGIQQTLMYGALSAAGAIGGGFVANMIPLPDPRMKAALPLAMGVGLSMTKFGQQKQLQPMIAGLLTVGTLSLIKQFAPQIPMLAGEGEEDLIDDDEALDLLGLEDYDEEDDLDLLGVTADEDDLDELTGDSVDVSGDDDFITSADI